GRARESVLEKMIQTSEFVRLKILVAAFPKSFLNLREILFRSNLQILVAVEGQNRTLRFLQYGNKIVIQEKTKPERGHHTGLGFEHCQQQRDAHPNGIDELR